MKGKRTLKEERDLDFTLGITWGIVLGGFVGVVLAAVILMVNGYSLTSAERAAVREYWDAPLSKQMLVKRILDSDEEMSNFSNASLQELEWLKLAATVVQNNADNPDVLEATRLISQFDATEVPTVTPKPTAKPTETAAPSTLDEKPVTLNEYPMDEPPELTLTTEVQPDYSWITETYSYSKLTEIPAELPEDCKALRLTLSDPCNYGYGSRKLAEFTHPVLGYKITLTVPQVEDLSAKCRAMGYGLIAVALEKSDEGRLSVDYYAFNAAEKPVLKIWFSTSHSFSTSTQVDVPVALLSMYARRQTDDGKYWINWSSGYDNYAFWGAGGGEDSNYLFNAYTLSVSPNAKSHSALDGALKSLDEYAEYWAEKQTSIQRLLNYFNADRSEFYIDRLAADQGITKMLARSVQWVYQRDDERELEISYSSSGDAVATPIVVKIDGEAQRYGVLYWMLRVGGLPNTVSVVDANGYRMELNQDQMASVVYFMLNPRANS